MSGDATQRTLRTTLLAAGAGVAAVPVGAVLTVMLWPFWSWFEASTGIESLGHSGPATWCFVVLVLAAAAVGIGAVLRSHRRAATAHPR